MSDKRKVGRPLGSKAKPIEERNSDLLDQHFNRVLKDGVKALDKDGNTVTLTPSAAMLNTIRLRCRDLGLVNPERLGSGTADFVASAVAAGFGAKREGHLPEFARGPENADVRTGLDRLRFIASEPDRVDEDDEDLPPSRVAKKRGA